jgi:hypothetical protein
MRGPSQRLFWWGVAVVVAAAVTAGVCAYRHVSSPAPGELVQESTSPSGRWAAQAYFVDDDGFGPHAGVMRLDVVDLLSPQRYARTIWVEPAGSRYAARRIIGWVDVDRVALFRDNAERTVLNVITVNVASTPGDLRNRMAAWGAAVGALAGTVAGGVFVLLLLYTWARRVAWAREAAQEAEELTARRRAARG